MIPMNGWMQMLMMATLTGSAATLLLVLFKHRLIRRFGGTWYYYIWIAVLALFLLGVRPDLPAAVHLKTKLVSVLPTASPQAAPAPVAQSQQQSATAHPKEQFDPYGVQTVATRPLPKPEEILLAVWLAGFLALLLRYLIGYLRFCRKVSGREAVARVDGVEVFITASVVSPVLIGFFRPRLAMPDIELDAAQRALIYRHELVHRRRGDIWYKLAAVLVGCAHWFNPIAYLMVRQLSEACEYSCDEAVAAGMDATERRQYTEMILHVASQRAPALVLGFSKGAQILKRRFLYMFQPAKTAKKGWATALALLLCVGILGAAALAFAQDAPLTDDSGGIYTYYNTADSMEANLARTLNTSDWGGHYESVSCVYVDADGKKVSYYNRTEPVYMVITGWLERGTDLNGAPLKTLSVDGRDVLVAFSGDTAKYQDNDILEQMVVKQIRFESTYQGRGYDHPAFANTLIERGIYVFENVTPASEFEPQAEWAAGSGTGTLGLRMLTRYEAKQPIGDIWNGRVMVNKNIDGRQGVQLGEAAVLAGQTLAIDVRETTDTMPTINVAIWDVDTGLAIEWMPNMTGNRFYFTPNEHGAGHRYRVVVSTEEAAGDIANLHVFTYQN